MPDQKREKKPAPKIPGPSPTKPRNPGKRQEPPPAEPGSKPAGQDAGKKPPKFTSGDDAPPAKNKNLFGEDIDGKFLAKTRMRVSISKVIGDVLLFQDGDYFKYKYGTIEGVGDTTEDAAREFKKAYRAKN
jgi:hypothetical protein